MGKHSIFIGYRREDAPDACSRVYDALAPVFGPGAMFMDIDDMPYGRDFSEFVKTILPQCSVFLAMIGPRWLEVRDASGQRRLDDPKDLVRREIELALEAPDVQVIPVLLNGVQMPNADMLPESLRPLVGLNAARIRREDFRDDIDRLVVALKERVRTGATVTVPGAAKPASVVAQSTAAPAESVATNLLLVAGLPARGKSVFLSHLLRYLYKSGDFAVDVVDAEPRARDMLRRWRDDWSKNRLPARTDTGPPIQLVLDVRASARDRPPLRFALLDESGERADGQVRKDGSFFTPDLQDQISAGNARIVLVLVCNGAIVDADDELFASVLVDLLQIDPAALNRIAILILVADTAATRRLLVHKQRAESVDGRHLSMSDVAGIAFCRAFLRQTVAHLSRADADARVVDFDVGDTAIDDNGASYILRQRFDDVRSIFHWMYQHFTGAPLVKPSLAERLLPKMAASEVFDATFWCVTAVSAVLTGYMAWHGFHALMGPIAVVPVVVITGLIALTAAAMRLARLMRVSMRHAALASLAPTLISLAASSAYLHARARGEAGAVGILDQLAKMASAVETGAIQLPLFAVATAIFIVQMPLMAAYVMISPKPLASAFRPPKQKARLGRATGGRARG